MPYIRTWQMEPLAPAVLASLTPSGVDVRFYDDRMEIIPFDEPTDLVAISVETYTARRAYQIASEYRSRGVPVVMGGFHATLVPEEAAEYAESVVVGEAEEVWPRIIEDFRNGELKRQYRSVSRPSLASLMPDRSIFRGKRYLPIALIEAGRGCQMRCEFCAVQSYFGGTQSRRSIEGVVEEVRRLNKRLYFFVDDNIASNMDQAKELFHALIPLKIKWVAQASVHAAHDREFLGLIRAAGCQGLLVGLETLDSGNLRQMGKMFNDTDGGVGEAVERFHGAGIRLYPTFIFGYDADTVASIREAVEFSRRHGFFMAAFNHLTPFPGTPLYERLRREGRLLYEKWWLDPAYRYGMLPFRPAGMSAVEVGEECLRARKYFFSLPSILRRALKFRVNSRNPSMLLETLAINMMMRKEVSQRPELGMGDGLFKGPLLKVAGAGTIAAPFHAAGGEAS